MRPFLTPDRNQATFMPPAIEDWLPENHMARFIIDICSQLNLTTIYQQYGQTGSTPYDPCMMLGLLFYGYATGVFSSRKLEAATYDSVAFRYITGDLHPDHDSIANFRKRFLPQIKESFAQILFIGNQMGPRQFELPPNILLFDSPGSYATVYVCPPASNSYGRVLW